MAQGPPKRIHGASSAGLLSVRLGVGQTERCTAQSRAWNPADFGLLPDGNLIVVTSESLLALGFLTIKWP